MECLLDVCSKGNIKMKTLVYGFILTWCTVVVGVSSSVSCYFCDSLDSGECNDPFQENGDHVTIEDNCEYCLKYKFESPYKGIKRNCTKVESNRVSYKYGCASWDFSSSNYAYEECACSKNLCNGTRSQKASMLSILSVWMILCVICKLFSE